MLIREDSLEGYLVTTIQKQNEDSNEISFETTAFERPSGHWIMRFSCDDLDKANKNHERMMVHIEKEYVSKKIQHDRNFFSLSSQFL